MKDNVPGDLGVRFSFGRVYGNGPDRGEIKPSLEITDATSGKVLKIALTAEDIAEMLAGGAARVEAANVQGLKGLNDWGKFQHHKTIYVPTKSDDWKVTDRDKPTDLPHVALAVQSLKQEGYRADRPHRNNRGQWVVIGRKYTDERPA